jgi:hypothetical protein
MKKGLKKKTKAEHYEAQNDKSYLLPLSHEGNRE